ncbi:MAG: indole-3-glycerol phosphate synthase TrpC [Alphaproteobacteria bacterium]|nr:indole-3-glycerol phosphate synthase TrpC [Alphaproteobacteria bacterium]
MSDKLQEICARKRDHVAACKASRPRAAVEEAAGAAGPVRGFRAALEAKLAGGGLGLIAEIKRASPSAGLIRADFDAAGLARAYASGGAACLSVLTDTPYFQGSDDDLAAARGAVDLPALRKDFMVDPYQIAESRALGADCVLLILAVLDDGLAAELAAAARSLGMDALVEVHDEAELERAARLETGLIGINNRNLKTLETDLAVTERLAPRAPKDAVLVCESGISGPQDISRMAAAGPRCFLVGESLMREADVAAAARALLAAEVPGAQAMEA